MAGQYHHHHNQGQGFATSSSSAASPRQISHMQPQPDLFTPEMRDLQARGRDPYGRGSSDGDWSSLHMNHVWEEVPHSVTERSRLAREVLDQPELLMFTAQKENDSIPATRLRYMRMLCGLPEKPPSKSNLSGKNKGIAAASSSSSSSSKRQQQQQKQQSRQSR